MKWFGVLRLQDRVAFALGSLVAIFVAVQGLLAFIQLQNQEDLLVDEIVMAEAQRLAQRIESGELSPDAVGPALQLGPRLSAWLLRESAPSLASVPEHLRALAPGAHRLHASNEALHIVVLPVARGRLVVQYDASLYEALVGRYGALLFVTGMVCVGLAGAVSIYLSRLVVAPLRRLARQFSSWAPGSTVPRSLVSDEEAQLLDAFDRVRLRLEQSVAREREFTDNASHELRTPLAAIRTDAEMLAAAAPLDVQHRQRVERIMQTVDAMAGSLDALRSLARQPELPADRVDLAQCVDAAWASLKLQGTHARLEFVNAVPTGQTVTIDRQALLTILRNLIRNAMEHAAPAQCVVSRTEQGLEVRDDGPGIGPEDLPFVFERYYRGRLLDSRQGGAGEAPANRGLGLAIAKRTADIHGWTLSVQSGPGRGTRFLLGLAAN